PIVPTGATYIQGVAYQADNDNPVRPAGNHADKNLALRGLKNVTGQPDYTPSVINYGTDDAFGPQIPYLFGPSATTPPTIASYYQVYDWNWADPPDPGTRSTNIVDTPWPIQGLGLAATPGQLIYTPRTGQDHPIAPGYQAMVIYADAQNIALRYTPDDTGGAGGDGTRNGYTLHIRNMWVDPTLLALYNSLDNAARNTYYGFPDYNADYFLPYLSAGQPIGYAAGAEIQVVINDSGGFMDPRSCNEWWIGFFNSSNCPNRDGSIIRLPGTR
ncbi:MAG TPA: hypothetical protein VI793_10660, partial [Anaerolineales bacterium]|nr:hypothetical protein [Anaerolineales bacterium]